MINHISELFGRQINELELPVKLKNDCRLSFRPAVIIKSGRPWCARCHTKLNPAVAQLPDNQYYCYACIQMGRMDTLHRLVTVAEPNQFARIVKPMSWQGQLTNLQQQCADQVVKIFDQRQRHLLWAVTGAGKTEMLFPAIAWAVSQGLRVGIASPRVDVCIELFPRIKAAFEQVSCILLHGKSEQPYQYCQITVCTTHQLLRFYHAFDVMVIDEVDVFPFAGNQMLHFAVQNAIKPGGGILYLTATPDETLMRQIRQKKLSVSYLPIRYHGFLLPTVKIIKSRHLKQKINQKQLPQSVLRMIIKLLQQRQRFLLFVPRIKDLTLVSEALNRAAITGRFLTVYSADPKRIEKVAAMRDQTVDFLITTTILERGVTFPGIDVIVLKADDEIFSASALVQIAGRVGRNSARPTGRVLFYCERRTKTIRSCDNQIRQMNRKATRLK